MHVRVKCNNLHKVRIIIIIIIGRKKTWPLIQSNLYKERQPLAEILQSSSQSILCTQESRFFLLNCYMDCTYLYKWINMTSLQNKIPFA